MVRGICIITRRRLVAALAAMTLVLAAPAGAGAVTTRFNPADHGFHFINRFNVKVGLRFPAPLGKRTINLGNFHYGLCGGMAYTAFDYFLANRRIPPDTTQPRLGSPLHSYILRRQLDTFTVGTLANFASLPFRSTTDLTHRSRGAFNDVIRKTLDRGRPVPLGLVKTKGFDDLLFGNHQVLAIGYSTRPIIITTKTCFLGICRTKSRRDNEPIIAIYDPNYPDTVNYIQTNHNVETSDAAGRNPISEHARVRGYFPTPYSFKQPPSVSPPPPTR
jgi:hypothetical protein